MSSTTPQIEQPASESFEKFKRQVLHFATSLLSEEIRKAYYAFSIIAGLGIFFIYFSHINYTPRISLTDSVMLLFSALIIGVGSSLIMAGLFILPSLAWKDILEKNLEGEQSQRFRYLFFRQGIALIALVIFSLSAVLYDDFRPYLLMAILATPIAWLIIMFSLNEELKNNAIALALNTFVMIICTLMLINIALHGVEDIADSDLKETTARIIIFMSIAFVLLINITIASFKKPGVLKTILGALALLAAILIASQSIATIPKGVMHILGLGSFRAEEIIIDNELCSYFKDIDPSKTQRLDANSCSIKKAWILWKGEDAILVRIKNVKYQIDKKNIKLISYEIFNQ
ncbi:hypothetical protein [Pseudomonas fluorescens]|uniref:hypothetical protein n=1 Tax=Pseudomonas fluorescens TaxID=294 RepID=UPI002B1DDC9B|nr:hypothetical protein [Pseudomonas fluorescens]